MNREFCLADIIESELEKFEITNRNLIKIKIVESFDQLKADEEDSSLAYWLRKCGYSTPVSISADGTRTYKVRKAIFTTARMRAKGENWSRTVPSDTVLGVYHGYQMVAIAA